MCPEVRKKARDHLKPIWASARGSAIKVNYVGDHASILTKVSIWVSLQKRKKCKNMMVICKEKKNKKVTSVT